MYECVMHELHCMPRAAKSVFSVLPRAYKREGMQLGKHQNSHVGGRMCMNAHVIDF